MLALRIRDLEDLVETLKTALLSRISLARDGFLLLDSKLQPFGWFEHLDAIAPLAPTIATPTITPNGGSFAGSVEVTLASATPGATIYYTTDGSNPTDVTGTVYAAPFTLAASAVVRARAYKAGGIASSQAEATFVIDAIEVVATPTISPAGGSFADSVEVTLATATAGATIRYTTDGTAPDETSTAYAAPFSIGLGTTTLRAKAFLAGSAGSAEASAEFVVTETVAAPTITPNGGTFQDSVEVTLATATVGATIRYTTNGSAPTESSTAYVAPFTLTSNTTIRAKTFKTGATASSETSAAFTIQSTSAFDNTVSGTVAGGFTVPEGEVWKISGEVETDGSVVVHGTLVMRPGDTLRFTGINEANYVGGGMDPMPATDIGLWITMTGKLDAEGTPIEPWNRTGTDPSWDPAHEILLAPYAEGDDGSGGFEAYTIGNPVPEVAPGQPTEVFNLTRDVKIEGTPGGYAHLWIHGMGPQTIKHVALRYVGPTGVMGRYGVHFHMAGDHSRGSLVEGVVVRDANNHAFVPHGSHGVTLRKCIAFDTLEEQYWWDIIDHATGRRDVEFTQTDDVFYDRCLGVYMRDNGFHNSNFMLGRTDGGAVKGCVAVASQGRAEGSGFHWPSHANKPPNVWDWDDIVSHNHRVGNGCGVRVWQNTQSIHPVPALKVYNCEVGIAQGAYVTPAYHYSGFHIENVKEGLRIHSAANNAHWGEEGSLFPDREDGYGFSFEAGTVRKAAIAVRTPRHHASPDAPTLLKDLVFEQISDVMLEIDEAHNDQGKKPGALDFVDCTLDGAAPTPADVRLKTVMPGFRARFQNGGSAWQIDHTGTVTSIPPFYPLT